MDKNILESGPTIPEQMDQEEKDGRKKIAIDMARNQEKYATIPNDVWDKFLEQLADSNENAESLPIGMQRLVGKVTLLSRVTDMADAYLDRKIKK